MKEPTEMGVAVLVLSHLSTRLLGIDRTVNMFHWLGERSRRKPQPGPGAPSIVATRALRGLDVLPLRVECLDQAIAVWFSLNRHGHRASLKIGMRLSPLSSHAWVTCGEEVFVMTPGLDDFTVVAAYEPWAGAS